MLELKPLHLDQYKQVAEWAHGPQGDVDWDDYATYMRGRQTFGIYLGSELVGCIWLDKIGRNMAEYHVATARNKVRPDELADVLLRTAADLFNQGYTALVTRIPRQTRAAVRLAIRCGMSEYGHTPEIRYFILTRSRYFKQR